MKTLTKFALVIIMLIVSVPLFSIAAPPMHAQEPVRFSDEMQFSPVINVGKQGGYSNLQDKEGFLWSATWS